MLTRPGKDQYFMQMAAVVATRATCLRRSVGCVLVNVRGHVLATGYNGPAAGLPHCNEGTPYQFVTAPERDAFRTALHARGVRTYVEPYRALINDDPIPTVIGYHHACAGASAKSGDDLDRCEAIHAEQNALLQCRNVYKIETCYSTTAPCLTCVKLLMNTTCNRIIFIEDYPQALEARRLWESKGPSHIWKMIRTEAHYA